MTIQIALRQGSRLLEEGLIPSPRLTAEVLLCRAIGCERPYLYGHPEQELSDLSRLHYGRYLHERLQGKPTQYITRRQEFYGREFLVSPAVLIPRPETEHVVEAAVSVWKGGRILDVGCGSGAIAATLSLELDAPVWATDISMEALAVAAENVRNLGARVHLLASDVAGSVAGGSMALIVSNPPYVAVSERETLQREVRDHEPHVALFAGETGLEIYERLVADARRVLAPGGSLIVELGFRSCEPVREMFGGEWAGIQVIPDLNGIPRVMQAQFQP